MRPLLYLTYRQFVNGVKRSLTNPRRLLGVLFLAGYWLWIFVFPALIRGGRTRSLPPEAMHRIDFPPLAAVDAILFTIFALLSLVMMGSTSTQRGAYKPADVDILFPTPISPRVVLLFRIARDYLLTLFVPLLFVLFGLRPVAMGWEAIFRNMPNPDYGALAARALMVGWFLIAIAWVTISYAVSLVINRSDLASDRNRRILGTAILLAAIGISVYVYLQAGRLHSAKDWIEFSFSPVLRGFFFTASLATAMTMGPFSGNWLQSALGLAGLLGLSGGAVWMAMRQADWMYDQAAVRGYDGAATMRSLKQSGDALGIAAELARRGRLRVRRSTWLHRLWMPRHWALVWKEGFLQTRGTTSLLVLGVLMGLAFTLVPLISARGSRDASAMGPLLFLFLPLGPFMLTTFVAQFGFIEVLRRVDLLKPLPFKAAKIVTVEIAAKAILGAALGLVSCIAALIVRPDLWAQALGATLFGCALAFQISAAILVSIILLPDIDDVTQRQFRGLVSMFAMGVICGPSIITLVATLTFGLWPPLAGLIAAVVGLGMVGLCCLVSGNLFEAYNPAE